MRGKQRLQRENSKKAILDRTISALSLAVFCLTIVLTTGLPAEAKSIELRYGHMNAPASVAGEQAEWFAEAVEKYRITSYNVCYTKLLRTVLYEPW